VPLRALTLVTGANGSGKSSLYRALRLLADASRNGAIAALAREGGLPSTLWAGPETIGRAVREGRTPAQGTVRTKRVALRLGWTGDFGLPTPAGTTMFNLDPEIKRECLWAGDVLRPAALLVDRAAGSVRTRDGRGTWSSDHRAIGLSRA
jgi:predicted ATPase